jgi:hypothetical protein
MKGHAGRVAGLWPPLEVYAGYTDYRAKTAPVEREIPMFGLKRR